MNDQFFPFTLKCDRANGWSAYDFKGLFLATKPKDTTWYAYDVVVLSPSRVEFIAFGMRDSYHGGVGEVIGRYAAEAPSSVMRPSLVDRALKLGKQRFLREQELRDTEIIATYANELLDSTTGAAR